MNIQYYTKNVYGIEKLYIKDKTQAEMIRALTGQITISESHLFALQMLGHTTEEVMPPKREAESQKFRSWMASAQQ